MSSNHFDLNIQKILENCTPFDLNIEKILEHWDIADALREIIANALDEQFLTKTKDVEIYKDEEGIWHIRDYGRGLKQQHLTQNENKEKLNNPYVIGKFGIGLKDALATFYRKGVKVYIKSRYGDITLIEKEKHGFSDIKTLHACISSASDPNFVGTEFMLKNINDKDIEKAKDLFLKFSGERVIEETKYGSVLEKKGKVARIYINGVKSAEEENFLFSYNITPVPESIRKALNRERKNVGRSAYSDRVKSMLLACKSKEVAEALVNAFRNSSTGEMPDELKWLDVQVHAVKILNATDKKVVFLTESEATNSYFIVDEAKREGYKVFIIPDNLKAKISGKTDIEGNSIRDLQQFIKEYNESFKLEVVPPDKLSEAEKKIFALTDKIFTLIGGRPPMIKEVVIAEKLRQKLDSPFGTVGLWEKETGRIYIKRSQLASLEEYAGTLLHEAAHAISGASDVSREFELELSKLLGIIAATFSSLLF